MNSDQPQFLPAVSADMEQQIWTMNRTPASKQRFFFSHDNDVKYLSHQIWWLSNCLPSDQYPLGSQPTYVRFQSLASRMDKTKHNRADPRSNIQGPFLLCNPSDDVISSRSWVPPETLEDVFFYVFLSLTLIFELMTNEALPDRSTISCQLWGGAIVV